MTLRVVIVDDEELARRGVRARLERSGDVEIVAECATGREAIDAIRRSAADLVFLDVEMPGKSGFDVIGAVGAEAFPRVIFVTAHDRYAIRAFEVHAFDYLLKPIDDERFEAALERARGTLARDRDGDLGRRLTALLGEVGRAPAYPERFAVRSGGRVVFVAASEIDWVEAAGDYVTLHVGKKTWLVRETLSSFERRLDPSAFARIHRSAIVNVGRIVEMRPYDNGEYLVLLAGGTRLKLTRSYRHTLQRLLDGEI
jgi:two-component system, LytTR family, response regulator